LLPDCAGLADLPLPMKNYRQGILLRLNLDSCNNWDKLKTVTFAAGEWTCRARAGPTPMIQSRQIGGKLQLPASCSSSGAETSATTEVRNRAQGAREAPIEWGYTLKGISQFQGIHYSRLVK
jgi:hypothetical protein